MTHEQNLAARKIELALQVGGRAGLQGGVYDGAFCVWPLADADLVHDSGLDFFNKVKEHGLMLDNGKMDLDGGAGV